MLAREVVVIEVHALGCVLTAHIHHRYARVRKFLGGRLPPRHRHAVLGDQHTNRQQIILVGPSGVGNNQLDHVRPLSQVGLGGARDRSSAP